jgi:hypothetical protein
MQNKRGQLTVFVILAIIIVAAVGLYFLLRGTLTSVSIPASLQPTYTSFLSCLEDDTNTGVGLLESQAGYIYLPSVELGSHYYPFNSQLDFLGTSVPYWYYVSGNRIQKEQVPTKSAMEKQLERFINERIRACSFQAYYGQGVVVSMEEPYSDVTINDDSIDVNLAMDMTLEKGNDTVRVQNHDKTVVSNLGTLYDSALRVYDSEQKNLFLENHSIDVLRLYAPVDGVEISCSPKIWSADKVFDDLQVALEQNTIVLGSNLGKGYYNIDVSIDGEVRFLNDKRWPSTFEVAPSEDNLLMASPVGNQPGLGVLGFCYVPYHFVYNARYPVLVQVQKGEETFQFPMAVVVEGNKPRQPLNSSATEIGVPELCRYKNTELEIHTFDSNLAPVEADVLYRCFSEICNIGKTQNGVLKGMFPQCVNGYVVAKADGYEEGNLLHSTTSEIGVVNVFLEKTHDLNVDLRLDGQAYNGNAIITFVKGDGSTNTVVYPEQKNVELSSGQYAVQVYVYKNSSLKFPETTKTECVQVPAGGIGGFFGLTAEKCIDIRIPSQIISSVLAGGGKQDYYILESELTSSDVVRINAESLPLPTSLEQLQNNFILFDDKKLDIRFE